MASTNQNLCQCAEMRPQNTHGINCSNCKVFICVYCIKNDYNSGSTMSMANETQMVKEFLKRSIEFQFLKSIDTPSARDNVIQDIINSLDTSLSAVSKTYSLLCQTAVCKACKPCAMKHPKTPPSKRKLCEIPGAPRKASRLNDVNVAL